MRPCGMNRNNKGLMKNRIVLLSPPVDRANMMNRLRVRILQDAVVAMVMAAFVFVAHVQAQTAASDAQIEAGRRLETDTETQQRTKELTPGVSGLEGIEVPTSPGDEDLGDQVILKQKTEREKIFSLFGDIMLLQTDNALLEKQGGKDDQLWVGQVGLGVQPKINDRTFYDVTVRQQFFRYERFQNLDFDSFNASGGIMHVLEKFWDTAIFGRYNYNRLTDTIDGHEIFTNHTLLFGAQKIFPISKAHYVYVGHSSQIAISDPTSVQRNDYSLFCGYHVDLTRACSYDFGYRFAYEPYNLKTLEGEREDMNQSVTSGITYKFNEYLSVFGFASITLNNSNQPAYNYDVCNAGGGLNVIYKF